MERAVFHAQVVSPRDVRHYLAVNGTDPTRRDIDVPAAGASDNGASADRASANGAAAEQPPGPWGIRRLEVAQPPATPWAASPVVSPGVPLRRDRAARSALVPEPAGDPDPITTELLSLPLFGNEPPRPHPPVAPAPAAWRTVSTTEVLRSILPPVEPGLVSEPSQHTVATAVRAAMLGTGATPGTAIQAPAGRSAAATQALPGAVVGVSAWPDEVDAEIEPAVDRAAAPRPSLRRRVLWELLVIIGLAVAVAVLYEALSIFLNRSPGLGNLGGLIVLTSAGVRSPLYDSSSWLNASSMNGEGVAGS